MDHFLQNWGSAVYYSLGFFWMALWAFAFGYLVSSMIQVFVTEKRMKELMGHNPTKGVAIGTFFGFISSSCSFSALATTKSIFQKGASFVASMAFLLASTNLVIELGIVIFIFLGWEFVLGEYVGALLLILFCWGLIALLKPKRLISQARENLKSSSPAMGEDGESPAGFWEKIRSEKNWAKVAKQYGMEWKMVWKDVTLGFTVAGLVAVLVPDAFFHTLFVQSGNGDYSFLQILEHVLVGPIAAFLTFIGSMGNIPLAALLFSKGVSFAGVMAFIFSDLVVFPVLRINAKYYGWKMSLFIAGILYLSLALAAICLHYGLAAWGALPDPSQVQLQGMELFKLDYSFYLNWAFVLISGFMIWLGYYKHQGLHYMKEMANKGKTLENILKYLALASLLWLTVGGLIILFS